MSAMPRKRLLAVKASSVAMGQLRTSVAPRLGPVRNRTAVRGSLE
jgi:hypothetical protein